MVDLHCHTHLSDNSMSVLEVINLAKKEGVTHLAITDHDTTDGLDQAIKIGKDVEVAIIPGIEISAYDFSREVQVHILGLYVQPGHPALKELCDPLLYRRQAKSWKIFQILIANGYQITWDQVTRYASITGVFKQHIMHALMDAGYCNSIFGQLYEELFNGTDSRYPGIANLTMEYADAIAAIQAIREAGGVPVLAHPGCSNNFTAIPDLVKAGLEGIEVKHPAHNEFLENCAANQAREFNLVVTGGADYHGLYGDSPDLPGSRSTGIASIFALQERLKSIRKTGDRF